MIQTLPNHWSQVKLSEIAESINPGFPSGLHNQKEIGIPHLRPMNINSSGELDLSLVKYVEVEKYVGLEKDDILFNNTNSPELLGKTAVIRVNSKLAFSNHMTRIKINPELGNPYFIAEYLHFLFIKGFYKANCQNHVNQASISKSFLLNNIPIPLPPLPEQHKIVSKIEELFSELDKGIENLRKSKEQIKTYRQAVLAAAFSGRLSGEFRVENSELRIGNDDPLLVRQMLKAAEPKVEYTADKLPEGWKWVKLGEVIQSLQYGTSDKSNGEEDGIPVIRMGNIKDGILDFTKLKYFPRDYQDREKYTLEHEDILFNRTNSAELVGKSALYKQGYPESIFASYLIRIKINREMYSASFLNYYINSFYGREYIKSVVSQNVGQANVNGTKLRSMPVLLLSIKEQEEIVSEIERRFSVADKLEQTIDENLKKADLLKQSILKQAFEGKLI